MKKKEVAVLIDGLRRLSALTAEIADSLAGKEAPVNNQTADAIEQEAEVPQAETETQLEQPAETVPAEEVVPAKVYSFEEVRGILADRARAGFREEIKAMLNAHGAKQLSEITDPAVLASLVAEAEAFGNG
ncbi:hypothetical protein [Ruminobacter sp. RM87]|uniref:hypothetical protein n=1 Tax=Ruminobacter sp. RM87 TaxID=1200567 RepID=UPI0005637162|nr:hypothetical protein [Ruminobacter sp. RM87]